MEDQKQKIRYFIISYLKRYIYEMKFLSQVVDRNKDSFDTTIQITEQFANIGKELQNALDYNFFEEEVKTVDPAGLSLTEDE